MWGGEVWGGEVWGEVKGGVGWCAPQNGSAPPLRNYAYLL